MTLQSITPMILHGKTNVSNSEYLRGQGKSQQTHSIHTSHFTSLTKINDLNYLP